MSNSLVVLKRQSKIFVAKAKADSTWKQYTYAFERFKRWAEPLELPTLPTVAEVVELYLTHLGLSTQSVAPSVQAYAAIKAFHDLEGAVNPVSSPMAKLILEGIKQSYGKPAKQSSFLTVQQTH